MYTGCCWELRYVNKSQVILPLLSKLYLVNTTRLHSLHCECSLLEFFLLNLFQTVYRVVVMYWSIGVLCTALQQVIYNLLVTLNKNLLRKADNSRTQQTSSSGHPIRLKCEIVSYAKWPKITWRERLYTFCLSVSNFLQ